MNILKQSTAATIKFGPFIDDTDGKTAETALTIAQADIRLSKNGGDIAQTHNATGATHDELGYYNIPLDSTDTDTLGRLRVAVHKSGALPVWQDFLVVTANVYDSLVGGSDKLDVNAAELGGTSQTGNDVGADVNEILTDTGTTLDTLIKDIPTVSEFNARTKPAADYALEATLTAIKGAGWTTETLKVIRDALTAVQADLDNPSQYKADVSALATTAHLQEVEDKVDTIDTIADAIKLKTDKIPAVPAQAGEYTAAIAALQADLDNPNQYKADVSGIPDAILAKVIVGTLTLEQVLKVLAAVEIGITTGGGTETIVYTGIDGTIIRLTGVDENGNRTAVIVTPGA